MRFFENIKIKNAAKKLGFTLEEYDVFLSAQNIGISEADFRKWLSEFKDIISLNDYSEYLKVKDAGVNVQEFLDYRSNYQSQLSIEQFIEYKNHYKQYLNVEEYLEISKISTKMSVADKIEYFKKYSDKMSSEDYLRYKEALKLGFDLELFLSYISLDEDISMQDYLIEQKLLKAGISQKDIKTYFTKYADLTVEQYIEYLPLDHKIITKKVYKKYLEFFASRFNINEYILYLQVVDELKNLGNDKKLCEEYAMKYMPFYKRLSIEKFLEYVNCYFYHYGFSDLGDIYELEAYIQFLNTGNTLVIDGKGEEERKNIAKKSIDFIVNFAIEQVRKNSVIKNGVLKKCNTNGMKVLCVPEEVVEIAENAIKTPNDSEVEILFHNKFKKFKRNKNVSFALFGTYVDDYIENIDYEEGLGEYICSCVLPISMEELCADEVDCIEKITAPITLYNCEALSNERVEWLNPNTGKKLTEKELEEFDKQNKLEEKERFISEYNRKCYVSINIADKEEFNRMSDAIAYAKRELRKYGNGFARFFDDNEKELYELFMTYDDDIFNASKTSSPKKTTKVQTNSSVKDSQPKGEKTVKDTKQVTSKTPKKTGNKKYEELIKKLDVVFPYETKVEISRSDVDRVNHRIESMRVGEQLIVKPNKPPKIYEWDTFIEVFDAEGLYLGYSGNCGGTNKLYKLADVLTAEVSEVTPLSQRRKGCKYALLTIKVDCDLSGNTLTASLPKPEKKFTVKYDADGKSGRKKFETLFDAQGYIEDLMLSTENGYAVILDEDGNEIPGEGGAWC